MNIDLFSIVNPADMFLVGYLIGEFLMPDRSPADLGIISLLVVVSIALRVRYYVKVKDRGST